jgi:membrane protein
LVKIAQLSDFMDWSRYQRLLDRVDKHEIFSLAGAFAYTTALALSPFAIIVLSILSMANLGTQKALSDQIQSLVGPEAGKAVQEIIAHANQQSNINGILGFVGLFVLLVSASAVFSQLRFSFDKIHEFHAKAISGVWGFVRDKLFSVGMVLGFIFLMIVSLGITSVLAATLPAGDGVLIKVISLLVHFIVFTLLFACMFRFIPSQRLPFRRCLISGVVACAFFLIGKSLIGLYLGRSSLGSAYGAAGSLIVLLVWIYYSSLTLLLSLEFTNTIVIEPQKAES